MANITTILDGLRPYALKPEYRVAPSEQLVRQFEEHISAQLPASLHDFLSKYAGIAFEEDVVTACLDPRIKDGFVAVGFFYGFFKEHAECKSFDIYSNYNESSKLDALQWIPLIECPYGNQIVLSVDDKDYGFLYFLDHEEFATPNSSSSRDQAAGVYLVNYSFDLLVSSMRLFDVQV